MENSMPFFTWECADELEGRLKKSLYHGGNANCMGAVSPVALSDLAVSIYVAAAPMSRRKLTAGYIASVTKRLGINPCTMMLGLLYCERLHQVNPEYLAKISSSDLFVISLVISSKFLNDEGEDDEIFNDEWATAAGLGLSTVNRLEREFLDAMHWKAYVSPKEFYQYCNQLETRIALKHGLTRGWFSYTDLSRILAQVQYLETVRNSIQNALQVIAGCTLMYGLSFSVLLSSALCLNTTYHESTSIMTQGNDLAADYVHPYASRQINRARQTEGRNTTNEYVNQTVEIHMQDRASEAPGLSMRLTAMKSAPSKVQYGLALEHDRAQRRYDQSRAANHKHRTLPVPTQQLLAIDVRWDHAHNISPFSKQPRESDTQNGYTTVTFPQSTVNHTLLKPVKTCISMKELFAITSNINKIEHCSEMHVNKQNGNSPTTWPIHFFNKLDQLNVVAVPTGNLFTKHPLFPVISGQK